MPITTNWLLPWPNLTDPPNGPAQIGALAAAAETALNSINVRLLADEAIVNKLKTTTVRYTDAGGSQSFPDANSAFVQFRTAVTTAPTVVAVSGTNNDTFTVQQTGEYSISAGMSLASGAVIEFAIQVNGTNMAVNTTSLGTVNASTTRRLTIGDVIKVNCFQSSGGARLLKTGFGETSHVAIKLLA